MGFIQLDTTQEVLKAKTFYYLLRGRRQGELTERWLPVGLAQEASRPCIRGRGRELAYTLRDLHILYYLGTVVPLRMPSVSTGRCIRGMFKKWQQTRPWEVILVFT